MAPFLYHLRSTLDPDNPFTKEDDKMVLDMINPVFKERPLLDAHFGIIVYTDGNTITAKVKDAAAAKSAVILANSFAASTERFHRATQPTAAERMQSRNELVGMCVGMCILGSLAGLIIWRVTGRLAVNTPFASKETTTSATKSNISPFTLRPYRAGRTSSALRAARQNKH